MQNKEKKTYKQIQKKNNATEYHSTICKALGTDCEQEDRIILKRKADKKKIKKNHSDKKGT